MNPAAPDGALSDVMGPVLIILALAMMVVVMLLLLKIMWIPIARIYAGCHKGVGDIMRPK